MTSDLKTFEISTESFSPNVLRVTLFNEGKNFPENYKFDERTAADYEIEFFTYSEGGAVFINNELYPVKEGDISFRRPGQSVQGVLPYNCYMISFDLLGNTGKSPDTYNFLDSSSLQSNYKNPILDSIPPIFHPSLPETYKALLDNMLKEFINPTPVSPLVLKAQMLRLIQQIYTDINDPLINSIPSSAYYLQIKHAIQYMELNFQRKILLKDIAEFVGLSPNYFHRVFTENLKITPNQYLTKLRLDKARDLLVRTNLSIANISLDCGFENIPYFSYIFKSSYNISPGDFRKKYSYTGI